jgi:LPXTG-motif cell wall-anchored protein
MNSKRAGTLFALTLTAGTLGVAGSASAAEVQCGTPAVDAVYETVSHPALSHVEVRWTRTVIDVPAQPAWDEPDVVVPDSYRTETVVITPAYDETVVITEAWDETVVVTPAQPAVYETLYAWVHKSTGATRWEPADWNGASTSESWLITTETRQGDLITPAVPAVTETIHHEAVTETIHHEAVTETTQVLVPGYTIPGTHHGAVAEVSHVEEQWAVASPGSEWADSGDSRVVVDAEAWEESVLVTPAQPAGPACPDDDGSTGGGGEEVVDPATGGGGEEVVDPATDDTDTVRPVVRTRTNGQQASALPARLAHTGSDTALYAVVGVFLLAGGVALTVKGRRMQD